MSECRWCDYGDHPYRGGREGTIIMGQLTRPQGLGNGYQGQQQVTQEVAEMCPECAAELGLIKDYQAPLPPAERRASILGKIQAEGKHAK